MSRVGKSYRERKKISSFLEQVFRGEMRITAEGYGISRWGDEQVLKLWWGFDISMSHWIVHIKWVNSMLYELHLNKAVCFFF